MEEAAVQLVKQEIDDDGLYPFVCGLCGYRFNRIKEYCKHFERQHSDMITAEFFHSCTNDDDDDEEDDVVDKYDTSARFYSCGVCNQDFATLCLLHDHFCEKYNTTGLYIIDPERRRGIPRDRRCGGSVYTGSATMPEVGEIVKTEVTEDDGDDDMEYDYITDEEMDTSLGDTTEGAETPSQSQGSVGDKSESGIAIQKITVNYGDHTETYDITSNGEKSKKTKRVMKVEGIEKEDNNLINSAATESEADEDMSDDLDKGEHTYGLDSETPERKENNMKFKGRKVHKSIEEDMFESYENVENMRVRRRDSSIPVPASQIKSLISKAEIVGNEEGPNTKSKCPVCEKIVMRSYLYVSALFFIIIFKGISC